MGTGWFRLEAMGSGFIVIGCEETADVNHNNYKHFFMVLSGELLTAIIKLILVLRKYLALHRNAIKILYDYKVKEI